MEIYDSKLARFLGVNAITLWPFIFFAGFKEEEPKWRKGHEWCHWWQQLKWSIFLFSFVPYYVVYGIEYGIGRFKGMNHYEAYRNISFEKEAWNKFNEST